MSDGDPYAELAALAEEALIHADAADLDGLAETLARSEAIVATLPDRPPPSARSALERASAANQCIGARLRSSLTATRADLDLVGRGRDAARSYTGATTTTVDRHA